MSLQGAVGRQIAQIASSIACLTRLGNPTQSNCREAQSRRMSALGLSSIPSLSWAVMRPSSRRRT
jgi:hypothetical protein